MIGVLIWCVLSFGIVCIVVLIFCCFFFDVVLGSGGVRSISLCLICFVIVVGVGFGGLVVVWFLYNLNVKV